MKFKSKRWHQALDKEVKIPQNISAGTYKRKGFAGRKLHLNMLGWYRELKELYGYTDKQKEADQIGRRKGETDDKE